MKISITIIIIIITALTSFISFSNRQLFKRLLFNAYDIKHFKNYYRFITYGLVHADWGHLIINVFVLYSFGGIVEMYYNLHFANFGLMYYLLLYIGALITSTIPAYKKHSNNYSYSAVGASGAVSAVLFGGTLFNPLGKVFIFPFPIGIPAVIFAVLYLVYSWYMNKKSQDNIGHGAHFWGAIFGFVFTILLKPTLIVTFFETIF